MKKIIKMLFIINLFLILLICLLKTDKISLKNEFPLSIFQIQSGSMMPKINEKDIIILWKYKQYKENDIITYKLNSSYYITHRIVQITENGYITKGDFNNTQDEQIVSNSQIKGKVIFHSKLLGIIYEYRYYLIAILIILLFI